MCGLKVRITWNAPPVSIVNTILQVFSTPLPIDKDHIENIDHELLASILFTNICIL